MCTASNNNKSGVGKRKSMKYTQSVSTLRRE